MFAKKILLCCLVACLGLSLLAGPVLADGAKGTAVIKGKIVYEGVPPKMVKIKMGGDPVCDGLNKAKSPPTVDQGKIVYKKQGNAVPYVFVYLKKGVKDKFDPPEKPVVLNQTGCMYTPHVFGMIAKQGMDIVNSDPVNHNVHSLAKKNNQFNFAQPTINMTKALRGKNTFTKTEVMVKIKCDVHSWMSAYVGVLTHPFFDVSKSHADTKVKEERGTFEIKDVPAGEYVVAAWHEKFGVVTETVTIGDGETKEIEFKFGTKKAEAATFRTVELASKVPSADAKKKACCVNKAGETRATTDAAIEPAAPVTTK